MPEPTPADLVILTDQQTSEGEKKMAVDMNEVILSGVATAHTEGMRRILENSESASNLVRTAGALALAQQSAEETKGAAQLLSVPPTDGK